MAKCIDLVEKIGNNGPFMKNFRTSIQSANLNILIGSGCSLPAISVLGNIEQEIEQLTKDRNDDEAKKKLIYFLEPLVKCTKELVNGSVEKSIQKTCSNYSDFIHSLSGILQQRKSNILQKKVNLFTTNYDLFIEHAACKMNDSTVFNDGFSQNSSLLNEYVFSTNHFYQSVYATGNLYQYRVSIPMINLFKIHGSLNWRTDSLNTSISSERMIKKNSDLRNLFNQDIDEVVKSIAVVLPTKDKFQETTLNYTYYELLRMFSNELDKENTLLISVGFSFNDEHILSLTKRALKNPTLKLIIFCNENEPECYMRKFPQSNNVEIIYNSDKRLDFRSFIKIFKTVLPQTFRNETDMSSEQKK